MDSLVGFRFYPTDEQIILLLTMKRRDPAGFSVRTIKEIDLYNFEPWELPCHSEIQSEEEVWYFFCEPCYKNAESKRVHRRTKEGYWKKTGRGSDIKRKYKNEVIGTKKILSFSRDDAAAQKGTTEWVIHEIAVEKSPDFKKDFVVCRLERKREKKTLGVVSTKRKREKKLGVSTSNEKIVEDSVEAETRRLAELNRRGDGYDARNDASVWALQSSDYPEQESSDYNGSSCGSGLLNSQLDGEQVVGQFNSRRDFQTEYSPEETVETTPGFFTSKSDEGVYMEGGSDANTGTESFNEWIDVLFDY
ncbi:hypothetical protein AB3S75_037408 [Citrus x aurantiifolia]